MIAEEGIRSIYKGATATVMRQAANSAIRFTVYGAIKDYILEGRPKGSPLSTAESFGAGIVAGCVLSKYLCACRVGTLIFLLLKSPRLTPIYQCRMLYLESNFFLNIGIGLLLGG